jgi:hypothetical protein
LQSWLLTYRQIFTFPVFPHTSAAGPTIDELTDYCSTYEKDTDDDPILRELAAYGGHLNRFTFLKVGSSQPHCHLFFPVDNNVSHWAHASCHRMPSMLDRRTSIFARGQIRAMHGFTNALLAPSSRFSLLTSLLAMVWSLIQCCPFS